MLSSPKVSDSINAENGEGNVDNPASFDFAQMLATAELVALRDAKRISPDSAQTELCRRANQGDEIALEALQTRDPEATVTASLLARAVKDKMLVQVFEDELGARKIADAEMAELQRSIEGPRPTALERLLAERIVICKYDLEHIEKLRIEQRFKSARDALMFEQRLSMSQTRYLQAIKALATVRRLNIPSLQLNVGQNQINVASGNKPVLG